MARVRNDEKYDAQRTRILAAAAKIMRDKGYAAMTMEDLASALGVTKAAIYYYFPKKNDLLLEICEDALDAALQHLRALDSSNSPREQLERLIFDHLTSLIENIEEFTVFFQEITLRKESRARRVLSRQRQFTEEVVDLVQRGIDGGAFRPMDARVVTMGILGMCNWTYRWYHSEGKEPSSIAREFLDLLMVGMLPGGGREAPANHGDGSRAKQ